MWYGEGFVYWREVFVRIFIGCSRVIFYSGIIIRYYILKFKGVWRDDF